jgi:hypothetical protein
VGSAEKRLRARFRLSFRPLSTLIVPLWRAGGGTSARRGQAATWFPWTAFTRTNRRSVA